MATSIVSDTKELGKEIGRYSISFAHSWGTVIISIVLIALAPALYIGLPNLWSNSGPGMAQVLKETPYLQYLPVFLAGVLLLVGLIRLLVVWREWAIGVTLYERGIEYRDRQGARLLRWEDIATFTQHITRHYYYGFIPVGTTQSFTLNESTGGMIIIDERLGRHKELGEQMLLQMANLQLPQHLSDIKNGKQIEFGKLIVDQAGVQYGNKTLPWNEVKDVHVKNGRVTIDKQGQHLGKWANLSGEDVPDAYLFLQIARQFMPQR